MRKLLVQVIGMINKIAVVSQKVAKGFSQMRCECKS